MCNRDSVTHHLSPLQPPVGVLRYLMNGEIGELRSSLLTEHVFFFKCPSSSLNLLYSVFSSVSSQSLPKDLNMITYTYTSSWSFLPVRPLKHKSLRNVAKTFQNLFNYISKQNLNVQPWGFCLIDWSNLPFHTLSGVTHTCRTKTLHEVRLVYCQQQASMLNYWGSSVLSLFISAKNRKMWLSSVSRSALRPFTCVKRRVRVRVRMSIIIISRALINIELFSLHTTTWVFSKLYYSYTICVFFRVNSTVASALLQGPLSGLMAALSHWRLRLPAFPCSTWYVTSKLRL